MVGSFRGGLLSKVVPKKILKILLHLMGTPDKRIKVHQIQITAMQIKMMKIMLRMRANQIRRFLTLKITAEMTRKTPLRISLSLLAKVMIIKTTFPISHSPLHRMIMKMMRMTPLIRIKLSQFHQIIMVAVLTLIKKKIKRPMLIKLRMKVSLILAQTLMFLLLMWFHLPKKRVKLKKKKIQFSWNIHQNMKTILQTGLSCSRIKTATMKNNAAVTIDVIVTKAVQRVLEVALSLAMDTSSMDSETSAL